MIQKKASIVFYRFMRRKVLRWEIVEQAEHRQIAIADIVKFTEICLLAFVSGPNLFEVGTDDLKQLSFQIGVDNLSVVDYEVLPANLQA